MRHQFRPMLMTSIPGRLASLLVALAAISSSTQALTILQGGGTTHVAFEAETTSALIPGTPETWTVKSEANASGGAGLIAEGANSTGDSPHSFAHYRIRFSTAGSYYLYYRWRADETRTGGDVFTANSSWIATTFGAFSTPGAEAQANYFRSRSNDASAPADNVYAWVQEPDTVVYTVGAEQVGTELTLTVGTREAGMIFDRFVLSTQPGLNEAQLEALANSETDVVSQGPGETHIAWEPEVKGILIPGTPEFWRVKSEANASGGAAIIADGPNSTGDSPHSFAQFQLRFATPGTYYLYYRWRADETRTGGDVFTANSSWIGSTFGAYSTPGAEEQAKYYRSRSNDATAPADNTYAWLREVDTAVYSVEAAQVGTILTLTVGTREAGMIFDRFVMSTEPALTDAQLDALLNSGAKPPAPELASAVGSAALNVVTVKFTRPLGAATVVPANFQLSPALAVSSATLDANDPRIVTLGTATQAEGTAYTLTVSGVKDTSGTEIRPGSTLTFAAWKRVNGWVTKEIYFGITGDFVQNLLDDPKYQAGTPDRVEFVRGFQLDQDPQADNYGARLRAFFSPAQSGAYDFFVNNDNEAELLLSTDANAANLASLGLFPLSPRGFDEAILGTSGSLTAGQRYLLVGLLKQGGGDVYLRVAARRNGTASPPAAQLPVLGGDQVSTFVNPDLGQVEFTQQPANASSSVGNRASFAVKVNARTAPVYYQWFVNGQSIAGANRAAYTTPVLTEADQGKQYHCVVSVAGIDTSSTVAALTVVAGDPPNLQPVVGINFVGGGGGSVGASLGATEVAGVVRQENWNNLTGFTFDNAALVDASGAPTPITLTASQNTETWYSGTLVAGSADGALLQGLVTAGASRDPVTYTLANVPAGTYQLIAYSVGFDFSADYRQAYSVTGEANYPMVYGKAETGLGYTQSPAFRRMASAQPENRPVGNHVQFDDVKPAGDGSLVLSVSWDAPVEVAGNGHQPAVNAIQLVKVLPVSPSIRIGSVTRSGANLVLTWTGGNAPFLVQRRDSVAAGAWSDVAGPTNDRTIQVPITGEVGFLRIQGR